MVKRMTEDVVRDRASGILGLTGLCEAQAGVGQITTFNQLGFKGVSDKPDGWYLPDNHADTAVILETKASYIQLNDKHVGELLKNVAIVQGQYDHVVGVLYNGNEARVFKGLEEYGGVGSATLQNIEYYTSLFKVDDINKERIYQLTAKINNCLHSEFGIKNLYHRMIFTACALVAKRYDAFMVKGMDYSGFTNAIQSSLGKALIRDKQQNQKLELLLDVFSEIRMNLNVNSEDAKQQKHVENLIGMFIDWVSEISDCLNSDAWRGEDVMGIFFNEFNRYKAKSEAGQIFTPEHITDFMYQLIDVGKNDRVLDATCGSGGFLVKAMSNMIQEAGGNQTAKAKLIKQSQLYGIEYDREIFALACANMLIHKDGKTNLQQMDARTDEAANWISGQQINKVLMNPPYEKKYGCMTIVENVLDSVPDGSDAAFILPEKKLEKTPASHMKRIFSHHRLTKVVKLPENLFFGVGVTTSIFVFKTGQPQADREFMACYLDEDGFETVKNKGRHDTRNRWGEIKNHWLEIIEKQSGHPSIQWHKTSDCMSYKTPLPPFRITEADFAKVVTDYWAFKHGAEISALREKVADAVLYASDITNGEQSLTITIGDVDHE